MTRSRHTHPVEHATFRVNISVNGGDSASATLAGGLKGLQESLLGGSPTENQARQALELTFHPCDLSWRLPVGVCQTEVVRLGKVLPNQPVGLLVESRLPGMVRSDKEEPSPRSRDNSACPANSLPLSARERREGGSQYGTVGRSKFLMARKNRTVADRQKSLQPVAAKANFTLVGARMMYAGIENFLADLRRTINELIRRRYS